MTSFRTRGTISRDTMKSGTRDRGCAAVHARRRPSHSSGEHGSAGRMLRTGSPHGLHAELGADKPKRAAVEAFDDRAGALRAAANDLGLCATERHPPSTRGAQSRSSLFAARAEDTAVCSRLTRRPRADRVTPSGYSRVPRRFSLHFWTPLSTASRAVYFLLQNYSVRCSLVCSLGCLNKQARKSFSCKCLNTKLEFSLFVRLCRQKSQMFKHRVKMFNL